MKGRDDFKRWMAEQVATADQTGGSDNEAIEADMAVKLGAAVRKLREDLGLNQTQLAALMATSQSAIFKLETGRQTPKVGTFLKIAEALDAHVFVDFGPHGIELELTPLDRAPRRQRRAG